QHRQRQAESVALPVRLPLSLYLRRRARTLVLAATRPARSSARKIYAGGCAPRILHAQAMCAAMHGLLRSTNRGDRQLARRTESSYPGRTSVRWGPRSAHRLAALVAPVPIST